MSTLSASELYEFVKQGSWDVVFRELDKDHSLVEQCRDFFKPTSGWGFLHQSCMLGNVVATRRLMELGIMKNVKGKDGLTPLDVAERGGQQAVADLLSGVLVADLYERGKRGDWATVLRVFDRDRLLAGLCSRFVKPTSLWGFLHVAAFHGHAVAVRRLISLGSSLSARGRDRKLPVDVAISHHFSSVVRILTEAAESVGESDLRDADPTLLPCSKWKAGRPTVLMSTSEMRVSYKARVVYIPKESPYLSDPFGRVILAWDGSYVPPTSLHCAISSAASSALPLPLPVPLPLPLSLPVPLPLPDLVMAETAPIASGDAASCCSVPDGDTASCSPAAGREAASCCSAPDGDAATCSPAAARDAASCCSAPVRVAATQSLAPSAGTASPLPPLPPVAEVAAAPESQRCIICELNLIDTVLIPCGHFVLCNNCSKEMVDKGLLKCPICCSVVEQRVKTYGK